jgi:amidase
MEKKLIKNSILIAVPLIMLIFCQPNEKNAPAKPAGQNYLEEMTVTQLQQGYRQGKYTIPLVVKDYLERIAAIDQKGPKLNSIIRINPDALQIAAGPGANHTAGNRLQL